MVVRRLYSIAVFLGLSLAAASPAVSEETGAERGPRGTGPAYRNAGDHGTARGRVAAAVEADPTPPAWTFGVGESLEYGVGLGRIKLGRGRLAVEALEMDVGVPTYRVALTLELGVAFLKVEDRRTSWIATEPLRALRLEKKMRKGSDRSQRRYVFDYASRAFRAEQWDEEAGAYVAIVGPEGSGKIPVPALDEIAFLYLVRLLPLEPGADYQFGSYYEVDGNPVTFRVLQRERIRVPAGRFDAVVVEPIFPAMAGFEEGSNARLYLSDDERRIILKLTTSTKAGPISFHLREYSEGERTEELPRR